MMDAETRMKLQLALHFRKREQAWKNNTNDIITVLEPGLISALVELIGQKIENIAVKDVVLNEDSAMIYVVVAVHYDPEDDLSPFIRQFMSEEELTAHDAHTVSDEKMIRIAVPLEHAIHDKQTTLEFINGDSTIKRRADSLADFESAIEQTEEELENYIAEQSAGSDIDDVEALTKEQQHALAMFKALSTTTKQ